MRLDTQDAQIDAAPSISHSWLCATRACYGWSTATRRANGPSASSSAPPGPPSRPPPALLETSNDDPASHRSSYSVHSDAARTADAGGLHARADLRVRALAVPAARGRRGDRARRTARRHPLAARLQ